MDVRVRSARPSDHRWIVESVDQWWGRPVASALPRLFLDHFANTSLVAEVDQTTIGFLIGFLSPSQLSVAYIHFVGVHPAYRRTGVATELYDEFFRIAADDGRDVISAITTPANVDSIRFHERLGFATTPELPDYNRPGAPAVAFHRQRPIDTELRPVVIAVCGSPGAGKRLYATAVGAGCSGGALTGCHR
jgi:ribosomal protein S18 acetylase RimI-like enzyme